MNSRDRKPKSTTAATRKTKSQEPTNPDDLADALASRLTIASASKRPRAPAKAPATSQSQKDIKAESMRAINAAMQSLAELSRLGWRKSAPDSTSVWRSRNAEANTLASTSRDHLKALRTTDGSEVEIERAALSVVGKLVVLDMHEPAREILKDMRTTLCSALDLQSPEDPPSKCSFITLPLPSKPIDDIVHLTMASTYLIQALNTTCLTLNPADDLDDLALLLTSPNTHCLLAWLPTLQHMPSKHVDSILTRAYTSITKACANRSPPTPPKPIAPKSRTTAKIEARPSPQSVYLLRSYALRCLVRASPGTVGADSFWDQLMRFTASFSKSCAEAKQEEAGAVLVLSTFESIVQQAETRIDAASFLDGPKFLSLCDYWITFAKRNGDIGVLDRVGSLIQKIPSSSRQPSLAEEPAPQRHPATTEVILEGTKLCGAFAQAVALVDKLLDGSLSSEDEVGQVLQRCDKLIQKSESLASLLLGGVSSPPSLGDNEDFIRISGKVDRALERLRRCAHKLIDSRDRAPELKKIASNLLKSCVDALQHLLPRNTDTDFRTDIVTRAIDSLFVLGRTTLDAANPQTHIPAYDYLDDTLKIIEVVSTANEKDEIDIANYLRCISGAFYNLAGSLYQGGRFGAAVPFLKQTCSIGSRALDEYRRNGATTSPKGKEKAKERENEWLQLEQQLYRRWELLGICYLKNGDRRNSYDAFIKCVHAFPFSTSGIASETDTRCLSSIFGPEASPALKPLSSLLDRVTYVGACELLLPPLQVSLYQALAPPTSKLDLRIVGILLEYQYEALFPHRWKEGARPVLIRLLQDMVQVYSTKDDISGYLMPIRRARVLVRCLEFVYRDDEDPAAVITEIGLESVGALEADVIALLSKRDLSLDAGLAVYKTQYGVSAHLWLANLSHRQSPENLLSVVSRHVDEANLLLDKLQAEHISNKSPKSQRKVPNGASPRRKGVSPRVIAKVASPKATRATRQRVPAAPRKPAAAAPARRPPAASKAKAPVTPKNTRAALQPVSLNAMKTPPRFSLDTKGPSAMPFDDFSRFNDLLMLTTRILGLLSLVLPRFQLLAFLRKLCQRQLGTSSEEFIIASLELAYEYAKLGKLKRASSVFNPALEIVRGNETSPEISAFFLLRFSETLALMNDVTRSATVYLEALEHSERILGENKSMSGTQRIQSRARRLELSAMACRVFALIQLAREDGTLSLTSLLQSLRLWNRAIDTTSRLSRSSSKSFSDTSNQTQNPFESSTDATDGLDADNSQSAAKPKTSYKSSSELQWRLMEGLIGILFSLSDAYLTRGSPREAEYFLKQVQTLGESTRLPVIESRALTRMVEIQLGMGRLEEAVTLLEQATDKLGDGASALDTVYHQRLLSLYNERAEDREAAAEISVRALETLQELNGDFQRLDGHVMGGLRRSLESQDVGGEFIVPELLATVLCRYIWLQRGNSDNDFDGLLNKLCSLPPSSRIKADRNSLMANLTLHNVHQRFQSDMFLNSLTESTIAIPMGMSSKNNSARMLPIHDVLSALDSAEKYFQESIALTAKSGDVLHFRDATVSLTLVKAFQTSLGRIDDRSAAYASSLLDASSAITLRREMLEAIQQKLSNMQPSDDFEWPLISEEGAPIPRPTKKSSNRPSMLLGSSDDESDGGEDNQSEKTIRDYWESVQARYQAKLLDPESLRTSQTKTLPSNWVIIQVHLAEDKSTLLISRQECGESAVDPLLFCVPLKGRRDNGTGDEEEHLSFEDAMAEFAEIIRASNEATKAAVHIMPDDEEARSNWWKQRSALDLRLKELLENIEFCWLGAFKTILSSRSDLTADQLSELRTQFDKVFQRNIRVKDKKPKARAGHKKAGSQSQAPSQVYLDDAMLRCFSALSPKCRDEELEDLLYFILDLYQFHGVPVVTAEVDAAQAVLDLRTILEEHNGRLLKTKNGRPGNSARTAPTESAADEHVFLVLDKNVQGLPWESLPILRGRSISRIPCIDFLHDRISFAALKRNQLSLEDDDAATAVVNPRNGYFILNPSGDLTKTEGRFQTWVDDMKAVGWDGVVGGPVTEHQFATALKEKDIVVYFGHGGGEQYIRSHRIRGLPTCAATMLWGCSSGALKEMGDFDRIGTPYNYMLGGCPTLIANLWDVTDRDIDKFSLSVFDKIGLNSNLKQATNRGSRSMSVVTAVAQSRDVCKLKYLTGAAPVVYGIPFYL